MNIVEVRIDVKYLKIHSTETLYTKFNMLKKMVHFFEYEKSIMPIITYSQINQKFNESEMYLLCLVKCTLLLPLLSLELSCLK